MQWWTGGIRVESAWNWTDPWLEETEMSEPMSYTQWDDNEYNEYNETESTGSDDTDDSVESDDSESCLALVRVKTGRESSIEWREESCSEHNYVICEVSPSE